AHYDVPAGGLVGVFVAALLAGGGAWAIAARADRSVALLSLLATALLGVGVLAILSVGVVFLMAGLVVAGLTLRRARADGAAAADAWRSSGGRASRSGPSTPPTMRPAPRPWATPDRSAASRERAVDAGCSLRR